MLHKWKSILTNWINCYSDKSAKTEEYVTIESLLSIISHLHQNLNLDESKSSILDAHTVEEFLLEKFPEFKYENGTVEATNQEDTYLAASLLLYFVCVNSKNQDIKHAMCSKLCAGDQEIILKFTKGLLDCPAVTCRDVQAAIIEACGEHIAAGENAGRAKVSETPPALRSLHGEVRRLQAALDAERFDRNYLQEELARTNLKVDKLLKDREQCKVEIVSLKAKLSAPGLEADEHSSDGGGEGPTKLAKQLEQLEERLIATQEQLDEAVYERDTYKDKVKELKQERDKWVSISQAETTKATQLADQLDLEKTTSQSLRELVHELRQHNQRNCLDGSQLECDDVDASAISLHNASVSSEACANVVEVQLSEEKAKVGALKQQVHALQDQLNDVTQKAKEERVTFQELLSERENDIFELKHRINEEIEEKNLIKSNYSDEVTKLNNELNELEQKLKNTTEHSRQFIDQQLLDIQTLQEEKLSLIQSLSDETTKLEKKISDLKNELDTEKNQKQNMKDDYENHMMKLKEKVLNRNNELVELQNNVCQKSEMIERLHLDLRREKQEKEKYNNDVTQLNEQINSIENELKLKTNEANELQRRLNQNVALFTEMNKEIDDLKQANEQFQENCKRLNDAKTSLSMQLQDRDAKLEKTEKYNDNLKNQYEKEKTNLIATLDEKVATVNTLQMQLHAEIQYKSGLENELCHLRQARSSLSDEVNKLNSEIANLKSENLEKERTIYALDLYLKEEKHSNKTLKHELDTLKVEIQIISEEVVRKEEEIKDIVFKKEAEIREIEDRYECESVSTEDEIRKKDDILKTTVEKLEITIAEKEALEAKFTSSVEEIESERSYNTEELRKKDELLKTTTQKLKSALAEKEDLKSKLTSLMEEIESERSSTAEELRIKNEDLKTTMLELEGVAAQQEVFDSKLKLLLSQMESERVASAELTQDLRHKEHILKITEDRLESVVVEKETLETKLTSLIEEKDKLANDLVERCKELRVLKSDFEKLTQLSDNNVRAISRQLEDQSRKYQTLHKSFNDQTSKLMLKLNEKEKKFKEIYSRSINTIKEKEMLVETFKIKVDALENIVRNEREAFIKIEKEKLALVAKLQDEINYKDKIEKEYQNQCAVRDRMTAQYDGAVTLKTEEINTLKQEVDTLKGQVEQRTAEINTLEMKLDEHVQAIQNLTDQETAEIKELKKELVQINTLNIEFEKELKKEVANKVQMIEALQRDNEQLQFTIEEDNSNHEVIVKEKDTMIERLEEHLKVMTISLESIRKDYEAATFSWEKLKIVHKDEIESRNNQINEMKQHIDELMTELKESKTTFEKDKLDLLAQLEEVQRSSKEVEMTLKEQAVGYLAQQAQLESQIRNLELENNNLKTSLETEKGTRDSLENEKEKLTEENQSLIEEKNSLLDEKSILTQKLMEEKSRRQLFESENQTLQSEKEIISQQLQESMSNNHTIINDKEILMQQLVEEISAKKVMEQQKSILEKKVNELEEENFESGMQKDECIQQLSTEKENLQEEITKLNKILVEETSFKNELHNEKRLLFSENQTLKNDILELEIGKEELVKSLSIEKSERDELLSEKNKVTDALKELNEKYSLDLNMKHEELQSMIIEMKTMKTDFKKHEDTNAQLTFALNKGLEKLKEDLTNEEIDNRVLEKLINIDCEGMCMETKFDLLLNVAETLTAEVAVRKNLEKVLEHENTAVNEMKEMFKAKEMEVLELHMELKTLQQSLRQMEIEFSKQTEEYKSKIDTKTKQIKKLKAENQSLINELNDVKVQLDVKVHSLKEKLVDNENVTDKLKETYECQIDNLNMMVTKLTNYLKEKSIEGDNVRKEKERLQQIVDDSCKVIQSLQDKITLEKHMQEKLVSEFDSERLILKNMVTVTESIMEDNKTSLNEVIDEHLKTNENLLEEIKALEVQLETERKDADQIIQEKQNAFDTAFKELSELKKEMEVEDKKAREEIQVVNNQLRNLEQVLISKVSYSEAVDEQNRNLTELYEKSVIDFELQTKIFMTEITDLKELVAEKNSCLEMLEIQNNELTDALGKLREDIIFFEQKDSDLKTKKEYLEAELLGHLDKLTIVLKGETHQNEAQSSADDRKQIASDIQSKIKILSDEIIDLVKEKNDYIMKLDEMKADMKANEMKNEEDIKKLNNENINLNKLLEENKGIITNLEQLLKHGLEESEKVRENTISDNVNLQRKCDLLQEYQTKAEKQIGENEREIETLKESHETIKIDLNKEIDKLTSKLNIYEENLKEKETVINNINQDNEAIINKITQDKEALEKNVIEEKMLKEKYQNELVSKAASVYALGQQLEEIRKEVQLLEVCKRENQELVTAIGQRETFATTSQEKVSSHKMESYKDQVSSSTSDLAHSSMESLKTISDLEKIIHDKNRTITTLQSDITYMKSLMAESENKLIDVMKELELTKEHCEQLSCQLKKIHHQKNEEIMELKKQVSKMSVTENRATQIIKVSAKYQAIILKRIAEIKSNTILKELTNFANTANCDNDLKRSLNTGSITMEDLENFLETTDRHLKRCSEKQVALQKERDRLYEVNRINESEIINLKKFLTELSVCFKTFSSVKELYAQKLTKVVSLQRTVRREILNLDGLINDVTMCKLERGYAAVIQDLAECAMNLERWVERCIGRTISPEKIKQAFSSDGERNSLATTTFQNASLEVQLEELENSFQKLLEEVIRAQKGEGARDAQAVTVMEVRAEYEDKLNRMKAKMKQLYQEQISVFKEKQKGEIAVIEGELQKARDQLAESSRAYEEHIRSLTNELWNVGEKFLMKKDEAEWLRRKQKSGSLMSLQHVHSSGLAHPEPPPRPSDTHSLRSLPVVPAQKLPTEKREKGLHMSDEEGEVFDNRCLRELETPRRDPGARLSELRWRNSLVPPHLKSSYPAETQFAPAIDEDDIKANATISRARKEVGITAYKKPGPPTPSKQAGRLSATDCDLRESLRVEGEPAALRKTSTPSRLRALFARSRHDDGTPRRRLSNIFRKK